MLPVPVIMVLTLVLVVGGAVYAWMLYGATSCPRSRPRVRWSRSAARADLYQDAINEGLFMRPGIHLTRAWSSPTHAGSTGPSVVWPP